jgi:DNA-binding CsgD family transcriptional regulator/tetratricopeptide (TPR) repeat protein
VLKRGPSCSARVTTWTGEHELSVLVGASSELPDVEGHTGATTLLERDFELTELGDALTQGQEGRGRVVLIEAPAGMGKTSLLDEACETAVKAGFACYRARATEIERDFAYGCVRQFLEPLVTKASGAERDRLFEGAAALSTPLFAPTDTPSPQSGESVFATLHGLYWLLNNIADQGPLLLAVDDIHWSDTESLRFFNYLAPRLDGLALVLVAASRSGESVSADLARLAAGPETIVLRPRPLSTEAIAGLCEQRLGVNVRPEFAAACREATGGNPFLLEALLYEVRERGHSADADEAGRLLGIGPAAVAQAVLLRLSDRPRAATALVRALAVLGDGASIAEAARLAEVPEPEVVQAADMLVGLAILKPGERLEFAHPILREAVHADIGPHERADAHARAARILAAFGASEERVAAQIADAEPAGDSERVELLRRVAADALARGAPAAAAAWLGRALAEPPPADSKAQVLLELGSAEVLVAQPAAAEHLAAAVDLIREPGQLATAARLLAYALTMSGNADGAVDALESAVRVVEPADRELALTLEAELAIQAQVARREARAPAARRLERHGELAGSTPGERMLRSFLAFEHARASESADEAVVHIERALAAGWLSSEEQLDFGGAFYLLIVGLRDTDACNLAEAALREALTDAQARVSIPALAFALAHRAVRSMRRGAVARAEDDARTSLQLLTGHGIPLGAELALAVLVEALIEAGQVETAEYELSTSELGEDIRPGMASNPLLEARGLLALARSRANDALEDLIEFGRRDELWGGASPLASRWRSNASLALFAMEETERARLLAREDVERARRWGAASGIGVALRATALVGGDEASLDRLREAVDTLAPSPARLEHARALVDLGATLRRDNRRAEARDWLQQGVDLARRCGAHALVERGRTELRAAGGRWREPDGTGVEHLTVSELRVAELAARGRSNPEIAQALFVTRKTVETHLGHVYRKLAISGRGELAQALANTGSVADG